jgi:signal transduction histidine kinase
MDADEHTVYLGGEQLCECLVGFEEAWEQKKIEVEADVAENVRVTADPELLTLVWNNLFSNAIKFTENGGDISVESEVGKESVFTVTLREETLS